MNKFKVGDVVKAIANRYIYTNEVYKWVGIVRYINNEGNLTLETTSCSGGSRVGEIYTDRDPEQFALVKKELEDVEVGDILVDEYGKEHFVMGVAGKMVWLSDDESEADHASDTNLYAMLELKRNGFTFKDQEPEIMELSLDEVARKFGKSVSEIRIKKE
jgi:hypothetical protein